MSRSGPRVPVGPGSTSYPSEHCRARRSANGLEGSSAKCRRSAKTHSSQNSSCASPSRRRPRVHASTCGNSIHTSRARYGRSARRPAPTPSRTITGPAAARGPVRSSGRSSRTGHSAPSCRAAAARSPGAAAARSRRRAPRASRCRRGAVRVRRPVPRPAARRRWSFRSPRGRRRRSGGPGRRRAAAGADVRRGLGWEIPGGCVTGVFLIKTLYRAAATRPGPPRYGPCHRSRPILVGAARPKVLAEAAGGLHSWRTPAHWTCPFRIGHPGVTHPCTELNSRPAELS